MPIRLIHLLQKRVGKMRPLLLNISAFGPFPDRISLDFTQFDAEGFYLISGDTGSGKTSIFDAISFALYGEAAGSLREAKTLRSQFARPETKSYVQLRFEFQGASYEIERGLSYERPKLRGEGFTTQQGYVCARKLPDEEFCEVSSSWAEELLGLDAHQFKHIVMLAQGEFQHILLADSKDRAELLRKLLDLNYLDEFSALLKQKKEAAQRSYEEQKLRARQVYDDVQSLAQQGISFSSEYMTFEECLLDIQGFYELIVHNKDQVKSLSVQEDTHLRSQMEALRTSEELLLRCSELEDELVQLYRSLQEFLVTQDRLSELQTEYTEQSALYNSEEPELTGRIKELQEREKNLSESLQLIELYAADKQHYATLLEQRRGDLQKFESLQERLRCLVEQQEDYAAYEQRQARLDLERERYEQRLKSYKKAHFLAQEYCKLEAQLKQDNRQLVLMEMRRNEFQQLYQQASLQFLSHQAHYLAKDLQKGSPCPVCGSKEHPQPAKEDVGVGGLLSSMETLSQESNMLLEEKNLLTQLPHDIAGYRKFLDELNGLVQSADKAYRSAEQDCELRRYKLADIGGELCVLHTEYLEGMLNAGPLYIPYEFVNSWHTELSSWAADLQKEQEVIAELRKNFECCTEEISTITVQIERLQKLDEEVKAKLEALQIALAKKEQALTDRSVGQQRSSEELKAAQKTCLKEIQELSYELQSKKQNLEALHSELMQLKLRQSKHLGSLEEKVPAAVQAYLNLAVERPEFLRLSSYFSGREYSALHQLIFERKEELIFELQAAQSYEQGKLEELKLKYDSIKKRHMQLSSLSMRLDELCVKLARSCEEFPPISSRYHNLELLDQVARGQLKGAEKIDFERYIMGFYFDSIIVEANRHLALMSLGRYELQRMKPNNKARNTGLDLQVLDNYTGLFRSVKSLSGGELFKASLSLALGMSDYLLAQSGGNHMESLFIDEGFGSLDPESLDQAVKLLMDIAQSERVVAIISHVKELKECISQGVELHSTHHGSYLSPII